MILSDSAIKKSIGNGDILINPFDLSQLNPASYDLTLGSEVKVYKDWVAGDDCNALNPNPRTIKVIDIKREPKVITSTIDPKKGITLYPNIGYLMHTRESVCSNKFNPVIDGKSSIARLFIQIHAAGYGDVGFNGNFTLEVTVQHPITIYAGMRIAQVRFHTVYGEIEKNYPQTGHYVGAEAMGARPSQAWRQFTNE